MSPEAGRDRYLGRREAATRAELLARGLDPSELRTYPSPATADLARSRSFQISREAIDEWITSHIQPSEVPPCPRPHTHR